MKALVPLSDLRFIACSPACRASHVRGPDAHQLVEASVLVEQIVKQAVVIERFLGWLS